MNSPLRVLHVIPSLAPQDGGPSVALPLMARALIQQGINVTVVATTDGTPARERRDGAEYLFFRRQTRFYKFSWPLTRWLRRHVGEFDLVHIHALFSHGSIAAARLARRAGVPYIVRPLGVLNRWGRENRRAALKRLSLRWVELPLLKGVAAMHYTSRQEQAEAAEADLAIAGLPSAVIPLGIDVASLETPGDAAVFWRRFPQAAGRPTVLFLSRIDEKKGLDLLLPAFAEVRRASPRALLVVAGGGEAAAVARWQARALALGITNDVLWTGFLAGEEKAGAFAAATIFVLPSYSENFGVAAVEALAAGLPVVLTEPVAVSEDVRIADAGSVVACRAEELAEAMSQLLADPERRARLSARARQLAAERFSLAAAGCALARLYHSIVGRDAPR